MKNLAKLSKKMIMLGVMLFALGIFTFTDLGTSASGAAPCCSECETIYQDCIDVGGTPSECIQQQNRCFRWCSFGC